MVYDPSAIEQKWQKIWQEQQAFTVQIDEVKSPMYVLEMFPYPSAAGLHMGHAINYTIADIQARYHRMQGKQVLYPQGYDSFGLPAENAAIKAGEHPHDYTENCIRNFVVQQQRLGLSYDWSRQVTTSDPSYYRWNQYLFLKLYQKGLIYRKKSPVNWCPQCATVLANEQVHNGCCWRHEDTPVEIRPLEQWFIKTTAYAEELLEKVDSLDWPQRIRTLQKNWIGKSHGTEILFEINGEQWPVFTTRPDTIFGVTFMVVAAGHSRLQELVTPERKEAVADFLKKVTSVSEKDQGDLEKEGVFTGSYALNPATGEQVPVYAGNFVVADYGSGMVMAVPAHDQRDYLFAEKYSIPVKQVIDPTDFELDFSKESRAYTSDGTLIHSDQFDGMKNSEAKQSITDWLTKRQQGKAVVNYKLRDWLVSRQRYWGTPIPMIHCDSCGIVPVPEKDLPILLPREVTFGEGNPLLSNEDFVTCSCPQCGGEARRETDTMDTFFDSSWYFLRFCDPHNKEAPFFLSKVEHWMPIDHYIGGAEHACMHLIYARFFTKALRDMGFVPFDEPIAKLFNQGMLHGTDGNKMSKSLGNVINPLDIVQEKGADALRLALMSFASPDSDTQWDEKILQGSYRFLEKIVGYLDTVQIGESDPKTESKLNKIIKEVTNQIASYKYNLAIIKLRELFSSLPETTSKDVLLKSLQLLHPFCPHLTEEYWEKFGGESLVSLSSWPTAEEGKINKQFEQAEVQANKLVTDIVTIAQIIQEKDGKRPERAFVYVIPPEKTALKEMERELSKRTQLPVTVYAVTDTDKHDPEGKASKAKPGRAGIYLE